MPQKRSAALALSRGRSAHDERQPRYAKIERLMPSLLEEMREDLKNHPAKREFVTFRKGLQYISDGTYLVYHPDDHVDLAGKLHVLENLGLVREITRGNVRRFLFEEELVDYLTGT